MFLSFIIHGRFKQRSFHIISSGVASTRHEALIFPAVSEDDGTCLSGIYQHHLRALIQRKILQVGGVHQCDGRARSGTLGTLKAEIQFCHHMFEERANTLELIVQRRRIDLEILAFVVFVVEFFRHHDVVVVEDYVVVAGGEVLFVLAGGHLVACYHDSLVAPAITHRSVCRCAVESGIGRVCCKMKITACRPVVFAYRAPERFGI